MENKEAEEQDELRKGFSSLTNREKRGRKKTIRVIIRAANQRGRRETD